MERKEREKRGIGWFLLGIGIFLAVLCGCNVAGYYLLKTVIKIETRGVWFHLFSSLTGFVMLLLIWRVLWTILIRFHIFGQRFERIHNQLLKKTIEATEQIAHGDFSVLIPVDKQNPYSEIAESINLMAQKLGTMESLRQDFISNVSHEIQSPLTSISGFATLLKNESLTEQQRKHYLDIIETEAHRLSKLSDNLLKLSSLERNVHPLTLNEFSLDKQIQNAILTLEPHWVKKKIELSAELDKVSFQGDSELMTQVWINLLHNAIKFTPEGGRIKIQLTEQGEELRCCIIDTGIGLTKEDQLHVFERFYKADKARDRSLGGNGLGLSLVKTIVELHHGKIIAESEKGEGSTFTVFLPKKHVSV